MIPDRLKSEWNDNNFLVKAGKGWKSRWAVYQKWEHPSLRIWYLLKTWKIWQELRFDNLQFFYDFYSAWIELLTEVELVRNIDKTSLSYLYRIIAWNWQVILLCHIFTESLLGTDRSDFSVISLQNHCFELTGQTSLSYLYRIIALN